jgi:predicted nucleic acid-binding protein
MTLRQTIQAAPTKANEIIEKLANTSNQAVKTRETLFTELSDELARYIEIEEQHLLPLLRRHTGTKTVVAGAASANKELRARLSELAAAPKNDDAFLEKLADLKKTFQSNVRDERKELLPAVLKALDDEEAAEVAAGIEAAAAEAEKAKRDEKRREAARAKVKAEQAEAAAAAEREAARAEKAAERLARKTAEQMEEALERTALSAQQVVAEAASSVSQRTSRVADEAREVMSTYGGTVEKAGDGLRAVSQSSKIAATAASQLMSAWMDLAGKAARTNAETSRQLFQVRSIAALAEVQQEYVSNVTRVMIEGNTAVLEIARQTSQQALRPLEAQLSR